MFEDFANSLRSGLTSLKSMFDDSGYSDSGSSDSSSSKKPNYLGAAGAIGDLLGTKTKTTPSMQGGGFTTRPKEVQNFLLKTMFPDIQKAYSANRPTMMMRQYTPEEASDPVFGSSTRGYMQERKNQEFMTQLMNALSQPKKEDDSKIELDKNTLSDFQLNRLKSFGLA